MGVVEPPTPPTEVTGVMILTYAVEAMICFLGMVLALRISMPMMKDKYQRHRIDWDDYCFAVFLMTLFWPATLLVLVGWKMAFPRGIKTQYEKEKELKAALKEAKRETKEQEKLVKDLEKQVQQWAPSRTIGQRS